VPSPLRLLWIALLGVGSLGFGTARALEDPTRPPVGFYVRPGSGAGLGEGGPVLQSVLISDAGRLAIISGELVAMGGKTPAGRLVKVSETEVVLQQGATRKTLKLYPGAEKREPGARAAHSGAKR
jgi:MSHA biogenesis protein MshK